jgi:hypothetical protein
MDMKKILQAIDGQAAKPKAQVGDMKRFVSIVSESKGPLNKLTQAETIALNTYNEYKLDQKSSSRPNLIDRYFKQVEEEFSENLSIKQEKVKQLAERASRQVGGNYGHQSNFAKHVQQSKSPSDRIVQMAKSGAKVSNRKGYRVEDTDGIDSVSLDIPLLMRIMEYSKEDARDDMALHHVVDKLIELSQSGKTLTMDHYDDIVGDPETLPAAEEKNESLKTDNPCWKGYKPVGTKKKNGKTVPNCVPK